MVGELCRLFRSRAFAAALCASVFVLALHTRVCLFESNKLSIKAFANDYDGPKVKADASSFRYSAGSSNPAAKSIASSFPPPFPDPELAGWRNDAYPRQEVQPYEVAW
jgi:hypothetical protein